MKAAKATMKPALPVLVAALALIVPSCMVGPDYVTPESKVADQWVETPPTEPSPTGIAEALWWRGLDDPALNQLVDAAYQNNLTLQVAGVRVLEARARLSQSIGELFPQQQVLSGQFDYTRESTPGVRRDLLSDQVLVAATWEIDFWGKFRRGIESDRAALLGSVAAYDDALVTLIADVAGNYVNIRTLEERLRVAAKNVETQKEGLRIATVRFKAGETGERDTLQAATQLAQTQATVPRLQETLRQTKNSLAVLLGDTPNHVDQRLTGTSRIPPAPAKVTVGIPKDLLRRRPDVRAAGLAAASKCALIGVAKSELYPAFSLSGEFGGASSNQGSGSLANLFNWRHRAVGAGFGFAFPLLDYDRLENQVRVQDAQFEESVLQYQNTVLAAQQEVEDGLAVFINEQQAVALLTQAATAARRSTELAMIQYKGGQTDYTTVLTAEQAQLAVEDALASAQGNVVLGLISIYRALGGGWELRDGHDVVPDEIKADMARRTDWGKLLELEKTRKDTEAEARTPPERGDAK